MFLLCSLPLSSGYSWLFLFAFLWVSVLVKSSSCELMLTPFYTLRSIGRIVSFALLFLVMALYAVWILLLLKIFKCRWCTVTWKVKGPRDWFGALTLSLYLRLKCDPGSTKPQTECLPILNVTGEWMPNTD